MERWRDASKDEEYAFTRHEDAPNKVTSIEEHHGEKFIPLIAKKIEQLREEGSQRKVHILDIGAGAGIYAEQLRRAFLKDIKVYTTGLSKKKANLVRGRIHEQQQREQVDHSVDHPIDDQATESLENIPWQIEPKISKDDLKWRSVTQLTNYPEFDFIFDTSGEVLYSTLNNDAINDYYHAVMKKLLPGGYASIAPMTVQEGSDDFNKLQEMGREIGAEIRVMRWTTETPIDDEYGKGILKEKHEAMKIIKLPDSIGS